MAEIGAILSRAACAAVVGVAALSAPPVANAQPGVRPIVTLAAWDDDEPDADGSPIDGVWILSSTGQRIAIRDGRSTVERTGQPMGRDIRETRRGKFVLHELNCNCRASMRLTLDGALLGVSHTLIGPIRWELHPASLDHPRWFRRELRKLNGDD